MLNKHIQTIRLFMKLHSSAKHKPCLKQQQASHRMKGRNRKQVLPLDQHTPRWRTPSQKNHHHHPLRKKNKKPREIRIPSFTAWQRESGECAHAMGLVTAFNSSKLMRICCAQTDFHRRKEASNEREGMGPWQRGRGGGRERSGRREKDITRRNRPLIATIIKRNVMCIVHFKKNICNMWRKHLWIKSVEFSVGIRVCVCVKMVGHKRKTLLPLGTKPLYLGITMAWGLRMCEEE
jgi:hypothetical protein